jgi:serine/threonine-protein kinase
MAYVHEQGIVHRDLKAANVRISSRGVVKLLDFGIAKGGATPPLTKTGAVIGTLLYMAPEQLRGEGATPRSDVWSLGVVLYEMVTGRLPFQARAVGELLDKLTSASYERPSASCAEGSAAAPTDLREVDRIVGRCLRRDPADRYASAGELLQDLSRLASRPAESVAPAAPEPRADTLLRPIDALSKYWAPLVAVAAALVLVVVGFLLWPSSEPGTMPAEPVPPPAAPAAGATDQPVARTTHRIDVAVGQADVYVNGTLRGRTPFDYQATRGETIRLELRQEGFAPLQETFEVTERPVWTFAMTRRVPDRQP